MSINPHMEILKSLNYMFRIHCKVVRKARVASEGNKMFWELALFYGKSSNPGIPPIMVETKSHNWYGSSWGPPETDLFLRSALAGWAKPKRWARCRSQAVWPYGACIWDLTQTIGEEWKTHQDVGEFSLVGGLEHFLFVHILGIIIPTDFHIFQGGRSTTNQHMFNHR